MYQPSDGFLQLGLGEHVWDTRSGWLLDPVVHASDCHVAVLIMIEGRLLRHRTLITTCSSLSSGRLISEIEWIIFYGSVRFEPMIYLNGAAPRGGDRCVTGRDDINRRRSSSSNRVRNRLPARHGVGIAAEIRVRKVR